ncbi:MULTISPECIES: DUF3343 domain-containing protein [unclassified Paenibacillus]|uniref:DUF3343 domain-containing protein n=1 Tax=unclassified Paenibacillus TaxID=185978 RepID=UPI0030DAD3B4
MEEELLLAFDSTQQALRAEMLLEYAEIEIDIFPTPKEITAGCAMSIQFYRSALDEVRVLVEEQNVEIRGIFAKAIEGAGYVEITEKEGFDD